ncbi:magnesium transporter [Oceanobacillus salinisoli]|uniref:magnesium transporter n=1 Tax=Oceanobacillus salinisoli TaxID=2678611 RepID=UPI002F353D9A
MIKLGIKDHKSYTQDIIKSLQKEDSTLFRDIFLEMHPSDRTKIFMTMDEKQRHLIYQYLTPYEFSEVFEQLDINKQKEIFLELNDIYSTEMFNYMKAENIAYFLQELPGDKAKEFLQKMDKMIAAEVSYPLKTAGSIMTKEVFRITSNDTASSVIEKLRNEVADVEGIYYLYVINEDEKLVGVISLRKLITAKENETIENIMSTNVVSVDVKMEQEEVARLIKKHGFLAVPVVSKNRTLVGMVTVDDVIDGMEQKTTNFDEISTSKGSTDANVSAFTAARKKSALDYFTYVFWTNHSRSNRKV